jgi:hypothetical protein
MQDGNGQLSQNEFDTLSPLAWLFLAIALLPHLLTLAGQELVASILSCMCFPVTMGPFALAHTYLLVNHPGLLSPMAWLPACLFTLVWFAMLAWLWRRNKAVALGICSLSFVISSEWIWIGILP